MNVKWNSLLVFCLLLLSVLGLVSSLKDLTIVCTEGCEGIKSNSVIVAKDGRTLKFIINFGKDQVLAIRYAKKAILTAIPSLNVLTADADADTRFQHGAYDEKNGTVDLPFTFHNISVRKDNKKAISYDLKFGDKKFTGKRVLDILAPPTDCGRPQQLNESYVTWENGNGTIDFVLCGNPAPMVAANVKAVVVGNKPIKDGYQFKYLASLRGITRNECGEIITFRVENSDILLSTKLWVKFTPANVENITAKLDDNDCLTVTWKKDKAGNCEIHYELQYEKNGTLKNVKLTEDIWNVCNSSLNDTINVRAFIDGPYGTFYGKFNPKPISPIPPPIPVTVPTPTTGLTLGPSKDTSTVEADSSMHWKYILAIVVGVIALFLIIAVVIIASRRKGKSKGDNNNGQLEILRSQPEEESDYAEVNSLRTPSTKEPPPDENHMVYAELGPGGGRTGPKPVPEESNYAKVKTEGLYYPPLQQSFRGEPKKPFYEPPKYSVASRNKKELRPSLDDDDDDYVEDILV